MADYNASEIYQFAIKIEENGEIFYNKMAAKLKNEQVIKLFKQLAAEEVNHKITFTNLLAGFETYSPADSYGEDYFTYLKAYAENLVFNFKKFDDSMDAVETIEDAFQFAIQKEIDTIAYFREMKEIVPEADKAKIEAIVEEERRHVVQLTKSRMEILGK